MGANTSGNARWWRTALLFAMVYLLVGTAFPNPPASDPTQFLWRLAAWAICAVAFATHIALEHSRGRAGPLTTALHASVAVALGACALAAVANVHALTTGTGNPRLLALALVLWPILTGVPAFLVAWVAAAGLTRVRPVRA